MLSIPALLALLPLLAWSTLAHPGPSKPTASVRLEGTESELFIGLGVGTTVVVNGVNKTCTSDEDVEVINVGAGPFKALPIIISYKEKYPDGTQHHITNECTLSGTPAEGAMFQTDAGTCYIRASADGGETSYGVTVSCDAPPYGGTCKQILSIAPSLVPSISMTG